MTPEQIAARQQLDEEGLADLVTVDHLLAVAGGILGGVATATIAITAALYRAAHRKAHRP